MAVSDIRDFNTKLFAEANDGRLIDVKNRLYSGLEDVVDAVENLNTVGSSKSVPLVTDFNPALNNNSPSGYTSASSYLASDTLMLNFNVAENNIVSGNITVNVRPAFYNQTTNRYERSNGSGIFVAITSSTTQQEIDELNEDIRAINPNVPGNVFGDNVEWGIIVVSLTNNNITSGSLGISLIEGRWSGTLANIL